jgi:quinol monooxygenase YgiN
MTLNMLAPDQSVRGRPFTSPTLYERDLQILTYMLEDMRGLMGELYEGTLSIRPFEPVYWRVHGLGRRMVLCDPMRLGERRDICVVGFFGERHFGPDTAALEKADAAVVLEFRDYPGILSYSSMQLPDDNWANLVLHTVPEDREAWRGGETHKRVVAELAPIHYRTVRIHNGTLRGGLTGGKAITIERTKYWDYRRPKVWQAVREL